MIGYCLVSRSNPIRYIFSKTVQFEKSFICAERQTDKQTDRQTDKHPQPCGENKPFGKPPRGKNDSFRLAKWPLKTYQMTFLDPQNYISCSQNSYNLGVAANDLGRHGRDGDPPPFQGLVKTTTFSKFLIVKEPCGLIP